MIKLIVSDMDGTLLGGDGKISPMNRQAIETARAMGVPFVLCTGRIYSAAYPYAKDLALTSPIIGCNGAIIKSPATGEVLYTNEMKPEVVQRVVDVFRKYDHYFHFYDEDTVYAEKRGPLFDYIEMMSIKISDGAIKTRLVEDVMMLVNHSVKVLKMGFNMVDEEISPKIVSELKSIQGLTIVQSAPSLMDIMNEGVSKGKALYALADIFNITTEEILAMGDNENDIEMLKTAGIGVAMGNAKDDVKAIADDVAIHHEEDAVAWALEKYVISQDSRESSKISSKVSTV